METGRSAVGASAAVRSVGWRGVLSRWPSAVGLVAATVMLVSGVEAEGVATIVCVAALCYLSAAAFERPWLAWPGIPGGTAVVVVSEVVGLAWWAGVAAAGAVLVVVGLATGAPRVAVTAQTLALAGYGGVAVAALFLAPRAGLTLAGLALVGHAVWDVVHYRRNAVVVRSLSEFCVALDLPLGVGAVVLAATGAV
ncbi:hypothetical protein ACTWP5_18455 [Streptomyces sp. 4N509B]|uniref:hypothetical protein n=1 Tax=Streptomyces sp. 4N509B TaxID=3457413 RepID=UPI003FD09D4C